MMNEEEFRVQVVNVINDISPLITERLAENTVAKVYLVMMQLDDEHMITRNVRYHGRTLVPPELANSPKLDRFPVWADFYLKSSNIFDTDGLVKSATTNLVRMAKDAKKKEEHEKNMRLKAAATREEIRQKFEKVNTEANAREAALLKIISHLEEQVNEKTKEAKHFQELYGKVK